VKYIRGFVSFEFGGVKVSIVGDLGGEFYLLIPWLRLFKAGGAGGLIDRTFQIEFNL
jgi:hypothetical protein